MVGGGPLWGQYSGLSSSTGSHHFECLLEGKGWRTRSLVDHAIGGSAHLVFRIGGEQCRPQGGNP